MASFPTTLAVPLLNSRRRNPGTLRCRIRLNPATIPGTSVVLASTSFVDKLEPGLLRLLQSAFTSRATQMHLHSRISERHCVTSSEEHLLIIEKQGPVAVDPAYGRYSTGTLKWKPLP
jgi:hypothetical protein